MSIASEIARIKDAKLSIRYAVWGAMGLKTYGEVFRTTLTERGVIETGKSIFTGIPCIIKIVFASEDDCWSFMYDANGSVWTENSVGDTFDYCDGIDMVENGNVASFGFVSSTTLDECLCIGVNCNNNDLLKNATLIFEECTADFTNNSKLDEFASALYRMAISVKKNKTITENGTLENGYYRDCTVSAENCEHTLADIEVAVDARNVLVKDVSTGQVLQEALDGDDSISGAYLVNMVTLTDIPDTTALESRVRELESELTNIETELKEL